MYSDLERIREGTGHKFVMIIQYFSTFVSGIVVGLYVNVQMTLVTLCVGPFLIGLTAYTAKVSLYNNIVDSNSHRRYYSNFTFLL